ncbi:spore germination protein [Ornithinibacillus xuwenensis]|uniref:Spore germination protein n=1 Tax=Ornithinibacillus xuwenensis TaxID=3144668 RepID=A0ABU9XDE3_9BACI
MPSYLIGPIFINSNEGQVITGDTFYVAPTSTSKVVTGAGSLNTGYWINTNNPLSSPNVADPDIADSNIENINPADI